MGTFHDGKSRFHGITVVVETTDGSVYVGRCEDEDGTAVVLLDGDVHRPDDELTRAAYLERAWQVGVWKRFDRLVLDRTDVVGLEPLGELSDKEGASG